MAKVTFLHTDEILKTVSIRDGQTILRAAQQGRVVLKHRCGGNAQCSTCKVTIIDQLGISKPENKEIIRLGAKNIKHGLRLSCQTKVYQEVQVIIPEDPYKSRIRALLAQQKNNDL